MNHPQLHAISKAWHEDADFRTAVEEDSRVALASQGLEIHAPSDVSVQVSVDSEDTLHIVLPPDPNASLSDGDLDGVAGGWGGYFSTYNDERVTTTVPTITLPT